MPTKTLRKFERVCAILEEHHYDPSHLIAILQAVQEEYRYLPREVMAYVATSLGIPPSRVYGVATFYSHFALEPKGKYVIKICDGTACHVKGSLKLRDAIRKRLALSEEKETTDDLLFTLEMVSCLGACGLAPAVVINEAVHGQVTPDRAVELVDEIMEKEKEPDND
ncbi:MAG: NAD(P)H-dependent oxidoreductase subunit E [Candidatus Sumerlaeota bacterium]